MPKADTAALNRLNFDSQLQKKWDTWITLTLLADMPGVLDTGSEGLSETEGLNEYLARVWLLTRLSDAIRAWVQVAAGEAYAAGASLADIGRASGKSPSNVRRDFRQLGDIAEAKRRADATGKGERILVDGFGQSWLIAPGDRSSDTSG